MLGVRSGYALGSLATGAFGTVPGLLLLPYLTDNLAVPAALAGLLVLLPKAWDVVLNPVVGRISDHTTGPAGPRRPYLKFGGIALAIGFAAMFAHPGFSQVPAVIWVVVFFAACATAFAFFQVPYIAMLAEITEDAEQRTRLMTTRIAVLAAAILLCGAGAPLIRDAVGGNAGYRVMGLAIGVLILLGALAVYSGTSKAPTGRVRPSASSWSAIFRAVKESTSFRRLWLTFVIQAVGIGTMLAGVDYMARVVMGRPGMSSVLFACFVGPALLVMPIWQWAGNRFGKRNSYLLASVIFGLAAGSLILTGGDTAPVIAFVVLIGVGYAGMQVFPLALLPDITNVDEQTSGERRAGIYAGVWTAGETFGLALGPGIYGLVLAFGGYLSGTASQAQPASAGTAALLGFSILPAICALAPLALLKKVT